MSLRIALTGGIACGKSLVAKFLNDLGVETVDADDIVHELIPDPAERRRLAAEVFADESKRKELEARLHPLVKEKIEAFLCSPSPLTFTSHRVAVIPLLFEARWEQNFDIICCVRSARSTQVARMMDTRGYTREEAEARLKAQMPVEEKAAKSHYVIENNGSSEDLRQKVQEFVVWLNQTITQSQIKK